jgi:2-oxo-4-hydroxy-4-carboxy-5-ureidoimidazoline decarboxylase
MSTPSGLRFSTVDAMDRASFVRALGGVFEHSPWVAQRVWAAAPFASIEQLHAAMVTAVRAASAEQRLALLRAHPDLAGKAARAGAMTAHSVAEQASAGLADLSEVEYDRFTRLNTAYRTRFGFPFIIAVRLHTKRSLLEAFEARLGNAREAEIENALGEVFTITRLRLEALVLNGELASPRAET